MFAYYCYFQVYNLQYLFYQKTKHRNINRLVSKATQR